MDLRAHLIGLWLCLAISVPVGYSSPITELTEQETVAINEVLKNLPTEMCDLIAVSSLPFLGEISLQSAKTLHSIIKNQIV